MTFVVRMSSRSRRFLKSLDRHVTERLLDKLEEVAEEPSRYVEHFAGDCLKLRIGKFRALVDLDQHRNVLYVRVIDRRSRIYKR